MVVGADYAHPRSMLRRLLSAAALLLLLTSRAQASPINLLFTTEHYFPTVGPPEISVQYRFFQSSSNQWPGPFSPEPLLAIGGAAVLPGMRQFQVSLDVASLDDVYFWAMGEYEIRQFENRVLSRYVAVPPEGPGRPVNEFDQLANAFGPPWIPLANLGDGISGDFRYISGLSRGPIGTWEVSAAPAALTPVAEPASMLLLGSGLAAVAGKRYRQIKGRGRVA